MKQLQSMLELSTRPDVLSFALGLPASSLLPNQLLRRVAVEVLETTPDALQMTPPSHALRASIANMLARRGIACTAEQILLTAGAQQALYLLAQLLLRADAPLVLDDVSYPGMRTIGALHGPVVTVRTQREVGTDLEDLARLLTRGVKPGFVYTMLDGHNPLAISVPEAHRIQWLELAQRHQFLIVEDDTYGLLAPDDAPLPLRARDAAHVVYVGSFSKVLGPALRCGFLVGPVPLVRRLEELKNAVDTLSGTFAQRLCAQVLAQADAFDAHRNAMREALHLRRERMLAGLANAHGVAYARPCSGPFVWVRAPEGVCPERALQWALSRERLAFLPGAAFGDGTSARTGFRLSFASSTLAEIDDGMARLCRALTGVERASVERAGVDHDEHVA